ncbi:hypothetical protein ASC77_25265 [Nocardioides sp. Root1257]|uniref:hypothetical protein n=1 Tax=unclassified Nocardioides TaxID=2615069 RepID=UPI0006F39861|nr:MULTISPECIES: hypothetical protein [unclassified Nocardioides]KQW50985.1 hypothetical protein ASC77_25265 [Nocardioides sp. Root1257]KRC53781.1 hypothetical protein ASE24_25055 [Nocardioides sp. Root224]
MNTHNPSRYEIRLQGRLHERWAVWFDDMTISAEPDGVTLLRGDVADQAALHGLLTRLRDLGLPLISVTPVDPTEGSTLGIGVDP